MTSDPTLVAGALAWLTASLPRLVASALVLWFGYWLSGVLERAVLALLLQRFGFDLTLRGVLASLVRYGVLIIAVIAALGQLGIETSSILTLLAATGLAIGLALQATLSNIAAGIMLLWLRPFKVGDRIVVGALTAKVVEVGLFASELHTGDGLYQFVPNSELWNKRLTNLTRLPTRLVDVPVRLARASDVNRLREALTRIATGEPRILVAPAPKIVVQDLAADQIVVSVRVWAATGDYDDVQHTVAEALIGVVGGLQDGSAPAQDLTTEDRT